jgi:hypothetical protein
LECPVIGTFFAEFHHQSADLAVYGSPSFKAMTVSFFSKGIKSAGEQEKKSFLTWVKNGLFVTGDINCHGKFL